MGLISRFRLSSAIKSGKPEKVSRLLQTGADPNESAGKGVTALMVAAASADREIVSMLVAAGAAIEARDEVGRTPLVHAILAGNSESIKTLLDCGAQADVELEDGRTTVDLARGTEDVRVMKLLMAARASRESS